MTNPRWILRTALANKNSGKLIFITLAFVFWQVFVLSWIRTATEENAKPVDPWWIARDSHVETCECTHPGSMDFGKNGFTCSDDKLNAFCPGVERVPPQKVNCGTMEIFHVATVSHASARIQETLRRTAFNVLIGSTTIVVTQRRRV
jgi:hypothetical protein